MAAGECTNPMNSDILKGRETAVTKCKRDYAERAMWEVTRGIEK
jgi:hypothetical protein